MRRLFLFLGILTVFFFYWDRYRQIPLRVIGQPTATGALQSSREAPFFKDLAAATGIPFAVSYQPLNEVGFKDTYQLSMLKNGLFDLVSLRFIQNSDVEPSLQGIDLGLYSDYGMARLGASRYFDTVDRYLQDTFNAKLLGIWTFGPQVFFCRPPIHGLKDLKGLKIRVASNALGALISALGGTPVTIPFDDTRNALALGLVDCAVTGASSANFAGWMEHTHYYFPLAIQFGLNGYAISLRKWNELSGQEQSRLQSVFERYVEDLWAYSETMRNDAARCIIGGDCQYGRLAHLKLVMPAEADLEKLRNIMMTHIIPAWSGKCEKIHPGCTQVWLEKVLAGVHEAPPPLDR